MTSAPVPPQPRLIGERVTLLPRADAAVEDDRVLAFHIQVAEEIAGGVELRCPAGRSGTGALTWELLERFGGSGLTSEALQLAIDYAFADGGLHRVEAYVDATDRRSLRAASRAGLRKEGLARGYLARAGADRGEGSGRADAVLLGRLADDPPPGTREAFTAWLNTSLPTKRAIAQALIRNERGEVLLCELVYKRFWDLPGGVVDPGESPAHAVLREIREELGVEATIRSLAAVSWLPPWRGWDDATLFLFDVQVDGDLSDPVLEEREIRAIHWSDPAARAEQTADYTARLIERAVRQLDEGAGPAYLENASDPDWV